MGKWGLLGVNLGVTGELYLGSEGRRLSGDWGWTLGDYGFGEMDVGDYEGSGLWDSEQDMRVMLEDCWSLLELALAWLDAKLVC